MALTPGTRLGPYEILAPLGAGGMGEVYRARDPRLDRDIAIKVIPSDFAREPERMRRFEAEARTASRLNHPNVVTIRIGHEGGIAFIAMELVAGESLRERLARGAMAPREALPAAAQIAEALARAHRAGVVHRDLKPENVMIGPDGLVKVLDFGLARAEPVGGTANSSASTVDMLVRRSGDRTIGLQRRTGARRTGGRAPGHRPGRSCTRCFRPASLSGRHGPDRARGDPGAGEPGPLGASGKHAGAARGNRPAVS